MTSPAITPLKGILKSEKKITSRPKSYGCARECLEPGHPDAEPESLEMLEEYLGNMTLWNARDGVSNGINSPVKSSAGKFYLVFITLLLNISTVFQNV